VVLTCDTKVENPLIAQLARNELVKVQAWIDRFGLPGSAHVATPSLANEFGVEQAVVSPAAISITVGRAGCSYRDRTDHTG